MALTDTQKANIRLYLGYTDKDRGLYNTLEGAFLAISSEAETQIAAILTRLDAIETELGSSVSRQKVIKAEDVILAGPMEVQTLWRMGTRHINNLSALLGVPVARPYFSSGAASGILRRG